jgi:serine/threonine-protein kinase
LGTTSPGIPLNRPQALAIAPDGDLLISNQGSNQVLRLLDNGRLVAFAGDGRLGTGGDGGPASQAQLDDPSGLAASTNGSTYIADSGNNRIRVVSLNGVITTFAQMADPTAIALGPNGDLYVADASGLQAVEPNGAVSTVIPATTVIDGTPADLLHIGGASFAFFPSAIAVSTSGVLYIANSSPKELVEDNGGVLRLIGATSVDEGVPYVTQSGLAAAPDGRIVVANYGTFGVDEVEGTALKTVYNFTLHSIPGLNGFRPSGVTAGTNGVIYVDSDGVNGGSNRPSVVAIQANGKRHLIAVGSTEY